MKGYLREYSLFAVADLLRSQKRIRFGIPMWQTSNSKGGMTCLTSGIQKLEFNANTTVDSCVKIRKMMSNK